MRIVVAEHIGETRVALMEGDRPVELHVDRWSERSTRAIRGEVYRARVLRIDSTLHGAFCSIGKGPDGFLSFGAKGRPDGLHEGAAIGVQVSREAFQEKGPSLALYETEDGDAPEVVIPAPPVAERLAMFYEAPIKTAKEAGVDMDALFDDAMEPYVPLPGGGRLIIESVSALTAIDVDSSGRTASGGAAKLAMELNKAAGREAARQIRLRGLGGVVAIDFLPLKKKADQGNLIASLTSAFRNDPAKIDIAPPSRFAIVELARQRVSRPLHEIMWERYGVERVETRALAALRLVEREASANRSSTLELRAGAEVYRWLEADTIGWRKAVRHRFGDRVSLALAEGSGSRTFEVRPV